jgi:AcrR family transcriptional regulator
VPPIPRQRGKGFAALPQAAQRVDRLTVIPSQRGRILDAMAAAVAEKGYAASSVGDVVGRAGVSRTTFYENFRDKEDCYLAAYQLAADIVSEMIAEAVEGATSPREITERMLAAYLDALSSAPVIAQAFTVEVRAAGPAARELHRQVLDQFADVMSRFEHGTPDEHARLRQIAFLAGVEEMIARYVSEGRASELPSLLAPLADIAERVLPSRATG